MKPLKEKINIASTGGDGKPDLIRLITEETKIIIDTTIKVQDEAQTVGYAENPRFINGKLVINYIVEDAELIKKIIKGSK